MIIVIILFAVHISESAVGCCRQNNRKKKNYRFVWGLHDSHGLLCVSVSIHLLGTVPAQGTTAVCEVAGGVRTM